MYTLKHVNLLSGNRKQEILYKLVKLHLKILHFMELSCYFSRLQDKHNVEMLKNLHCKKFCNSTDVNAEKSVSLLNHYLHTVINLLFAHCTKNMQA